VCGLSTRVVKEQRVVGLGAVHEPTHCAKYVILRRLRHRVLLIISESHHIFSSVPKVLDEIPGHVSNIIDAPPQFGILAEVIDSDKQGLSSTRTV
jgi:hypothetical protein